MEEEKNKQEVEEKRALPEKPKWRRDTPVVNHRRARSVSDPTDKEELELEFIRPSTSRSLFSSVSNTYGSDIILRGHEEEKEEGQGEEDKGEKKKRKRPRTPLEVLGVSKDMDMEKEKEKEKEKDKEKEKGGKKNPSLALLLESGEGEEGEGLIKRLRKLTGRKEEKEKEKEPGKEEKVIAWSDDYSYTPPFSSPPHSPIFPVVNEGEEEEIETKEESEKEVQEKESRREERRRRFAGAKHQDMKPAESGLLLRNVVFLKKLIDGELERVLNPDQTLDASSIGGDAVLQKLSGMVEFILANTTPLASIQGERMFHEEELEYYAAELGVKTEKAGTTGAGGGGVVEQKERVADWEFAIPYNVLEPTFSAFLGEGGFAKVFKAKWKNEFVAVKKLKWNSTVEEEEGEEGRGKAELEENKRLISEFVKEAELLGRLKHKCIVNLVAACVHPPNLCIVTEFAARGSLSNLLYGMVDLSWSLRLSFANDVAEGINYLHCHDPTIIHRDLKAENVLVTSRWRAKVADFGLVKLKEGCSALQKKQEKKREIANRPVGRLPSLLQSPSCANMMKSLQEGGGVGEGVIEHSETSLCGTPAWMAPELLDMKPYNEKVDTYAYGIFLWELLMRQSPYKGKQMATIINMVVGGTTKRPTIPHFCPPLYGRLTRRCWDQDPFRRPTFAQILDCLQVIVEKEGDLPSPNSIPLRLRDSAEPEPQPPE